MVNMYPCMEIQTMMRFFQTDEFIKVETEAEFELAEV